MNVENSIENEQSSISKETETVENIQNHFNNKLEGNSSKRFKSFCHEIEKFIAFLKDNEDLNYYIHKYP
jgi:hypothetical protein